MFTESIIEVLIIILLVFVPTLELRAAIPYGILATDIHWTIVFLIATIANILLGVIFFPLIDIIVKTLTKIKIFNKLWLLYKKRVQKKMQKPVQKFGDLGIAVFIGIPLPGSGSYTGSVAAYLMGMKYKRFIIANIIGVCIAAVLVTIVVLSGSTVFDIFIKH